MQPAPLISISEPTHAANYLRLKLAELDREAFGVLYLDVQYRMIAFEIPFYGTLKLVTVHSREIARGALRHNAAAVIVAHNHPSGCVEFSEADKQMTRELHSALKLIDVTVLDHFLFAGNGFVCMSRTDPAVFSDAAAAMPVVSRRSRKTNRVRGGQKRNSPKYKRSTTKRRKQHGDRELRKQHSIVLRSSAYGAMRSIWRASIGTPSDLCPLTNPTLNANLTQR